MSYSRDDGLISRLIGWGVILGWIYMWLGSGWTLVIVSAIGVVFLFFFLADKNKSKHDQEAREKAPCRHSIIGAHNNPSLCPECSKEQ